jgi:hypothetical protein
MKKISIPVSIIVLSFFIVLGGCTKETTSSTTPAIIPATPTITLPRITPMTAFPTTMQTTNPNFTTFTDELGLFVISYPPDWKPSFTTLKSSVTYKKVIIASLVTDTELKPDSPAENIILWAGLPKEITPPAEVYEPSVTIWVNSIGDPTWTHEKIVEDAIALNKKLYTDYKMLYKVKTTADGRDATIIDWEGTYCREGS